MELVSSICTLCYSGPKFSFFSYIVHYANFCYSAPSFLFIFFNFLFLICILFYFGPNFLYFNFIVSVLNLCVILFWSDFQKNSIWYIFDPKFSYLILFSIPNLCFVNSDSIFSFLCFIFSVPNLQFILFWCYPPHLYFTLFWFDFFRLMFYFVCSEFASKVILMLCSKYRHTEEGFSTNKTALLTRYET